MNRTFLAFCAVTLGMASGFVYGVGTGYLQEESATKASQAPPPGAGIPITPVPSPPTPPAPTPILPVANAELQPRPAEAPSHKTDGLELPESRTIDSTRDRVWTVQAKTASQPTFVVMSRTGKSTYIDVPTSKAIILVPSAEPDVVTVVVAVVINGENRLASTTITVPGQLPQPPPSTDTDPPVEPPPVDGTVVPLPKGTKVAAIFVIDQANQDPDLAALVNSRTMRDKLAKGGHKVIVIDKGSATIAQAKLDSFVRKAGGPPCVIVQALDGARRGEVVTYIPAKSGSKYISEQVVTDLVDKYIAR